MPRCVFHLPLKVDPSRASASQIRPEKMRRAFERLGYEVDAVVGTTAERKDAIGRIARKIDAGARYDFVYSETSTMPTLLTDPDHVPRHPNLDFGFFARCRRNGIPVGLFYRDLYWRLPEYEAIGRLKSAVGRMFYRYDLVRYKRLLNLAYFPSLEAAEVGRTFFGNVPVDELPPGCEANEDRVACREARLRSLAQEVPERGLRLFYVGGIGSHYGFHELLGAVAQTPGVTLRMCVRPQDWEQARGSYERYLGCGNVEIVHASGPALAEHLDWADLGVLFFDENPYQRIAIPYKTFEYLACGLPTVVGNDTAAGRFTREQGIGYTCGYGPGELAGLLGRLIANPDDVVATSRRCIAAIGNNTWERRAEHVAFSLAGRADGGAR